MRLLNLLCPVALVAATVGGAQAAGSDAPAGAAASADFRALVTYYQGHWQCRGHFANGTTISSDEQFDPWLDGKWLHELHDDQPPFSYHAHSVWGVAEPNGALTLTIYDNFGGTRVFTSRAWKGPSITFDAPAAASGRRERFVYLRRAPAAFNLEYQVSTDGRQWRLGDHVECSKGA